MDPRREFGTVHVAHFRAAAHDRAFPRQLPKMLAVQTDSELRLL